MTETTQQQNEIIPISQHFQAERRWRNRPDAPFVTWVQAIDAVTGRAANEMVISTYKDWDLENDGDHIKWEPVKVNWPSIGAVPVAVAEEFAQALMWAVEEGKRIEAAIKAENTAE